MTHRSEEGRARYREQTGSSAKDWCGNDAVLTGATYVACSLSRGGVSKRDPAAEGDPVERANEGEADREPANSE